MPQSLTMLLTSIMRLIPSIIILMWCIVYIGKTRSGEGFLTLIGTLLAILVSLGWLAFQLLLSANQMPSDAIRVFSYVMQAVSLVGGLLFGVGFLIIAIRKQPTA